MPKTCVEFTQGEVEDILTKEARTILGLPDASEASGVEYEDEDDSVVDVEFDHVVVIFA